MFQAVSQHKKKILLVDDDALSGRVASFHFEALGCQIVHVLTAAAALAHFAVETFDAILLDLTLPDKTGFETAALMRQSKAGQQNVPIIALTAHHDPRYKDMALEAGMNDLYVKPLTENCARKIFDKLAVALTLKIKKRVGENTRLILIYKFTT